MCVCVCVYKLALESHWGGGGDAAGVFGLAAIQHSTFLSDIQYYDLKKPTLRRNALIFYVPPLCSLFPTLLPLLNFSVFLPLPSTFSLCLNLRSNLSTLTPSQTLVYMCLVKVSVLQVWPQILLLLWKVHNTVLLTQCITEMHIFLY